MLQLFRINDPYRLLIAFIALIVLSLPLFIDPVSSTVMEISSGLLGAVIADGNIMYAEVMDDTAPFSAAIFGAVDFIFGRSITPSRILALLVIFFQAAYFSITLINYKAYLENTYVFAFVFIVLCLFSFDIISLSPELLASTFLLLALNSIFKEVEFKVQRDETILFLGLFLGISSLLVFSYGIFLLLTLFILIVFARINLRKTFLLIYGFILPHLLLITLYFYWGELRSLWQHYYAANFTMVAKSFITVNGILLLSSVPLTFIILSLVKVNREARLTKYQSQLMQIMLLWLLFSFAHLFMVKEFSAHSLIPLFPGLAYFITFYFLLVRRKWIAGLMLWIFVIGILTTGYLARYSMLQQVDFINYFPEPTKHRSLKDRKILVLGDDLTLYHQNEPATDFINWNLAENIFKKPDDENLLLIHTSFQKELPEVIVDESNLLANFLDRMPDLKAHYRKEGSLYYKINN